MLATLLKQETKRYDFALLRGFEKPSITSFIVTLC